MEKLFQLSILASDKTVYEGKVASLVVPGALGYLGVLANHAPLVANLNKGKISVRDETNRKFEFSSNGIGFIEVFKNNVNVILT